MILGRNQRRIVNLPSVDHMKPFGPTDHMGPEPIIEAKVWEDVIPPAMVRSRCIFSFLDNSMEGVLGNLEDPSVFLQIRNKEGVYLVSCQVMTPPRRWGMNPLIKMLDLPKKPTRG